MVNTAQDAARALEPLAGRAAALLFGFGLLNVSILAAGILPLATAYAICEAFGFESGLDQKFSEAPIFNGLLTFFVFVPAAVAIIPHLPLVKVMLLSQDVNGILLPIILDLRAQDRERPLGHGRARQRPGLQHGGLGLLGDADRAHRRAGRRVAAARPAAVGRRA